MKRAIASLFLIIVFGASLSTAAPKMLVRIHTDGRDIGAEFPRGLDIAGAKRGRWIDVVVGVDEMNRIDRSGYRTEIISEDIEALMQSQRGFYHDYPDFVDSLEAIAANHPAIAVLDTIGTSWEGRDILMLKISDNVLADEDEPEILFVGLHHAREWPSLEICLFYADTLTRAYGIDSHITEIVDSREIWIVPCENPDGYVYCHDEGHDWRKNRHYFSEWGTYGVDLNRNYDGANNGTPEGEWGTIPYSSTTHSPSSSLYCGPSTTSEPETQAIVDLVLSHDFVFAITYHTHGEMVIWPWGHKYDPAPDDDFLDDVGTGMASRIATQYGVGTYDAFQASGLYPASGDMTDWAYGFSLYCLGKNLLAYTVETCASYHPDDSYLDQIVRENFDGALYLCDVADSIADLLTSRVMPPEVAELDTSYLGGYEVSWVQTNPSANPNFYRLLERSGYSVELDDAEDGSDSWEMEGFTLSTSRYNSPGHSYFSDLTSGYGANGITTISPYLVDFEDSLTFWCWYDIETHSSGYGWDYAYAEVSTNGRHWDILDEYTGSSDWERRAYPLAAYAGEWVFFRFRYITDGGVEEEGFYVDDIHPVADFATIDTVSSEITDTVYQIDSRPPNQYWYSVSGHNEPRGWGDFGPPEDIVVMAVDSLVVEADTLMAGEADRIISITGVNSDSIGFYSLVFSYDTAALSIDSLTLAGTRGEGAMAFEWRDSLNYIISQVTYSTSPPYLPPGRGSVVKIVANVDFAPPADTTAIDLSNGQLGASQYTVLVDGVFPIGPVDVQFIRGDVDGDSTLTMGDAIDAMRFLYVPGSVSPPCIDAADTDDDGDLLMGDPVYLLRYIYVPGSPAPLSPFPDCGPDLTPDTLSCEYHPCWRWPPEAQAAEKVGGLKEFVQ
jgi:hypothetical protein